MNIHGTLLCRKKDETTPFAAIRRDLEIIILSEASQADKDKYHIMLLICGIFKKRLNLFAKQK